MNWRRILFGVQKSRPIVGIKPVSVFDQVAAEFELPPMETELYRAQMIVANHMRNVYGAA